MDGIVPYLRYEDAHAAIRFLEVAFGFRATLVVPDDSGGVSHAQLVLGDGMIMLGNVRAEKPDERSPRSLDAVPGGIYVVIDDAELDAHHARAQDAGATITDALAAQDYGGRMYSALDREGHHWSFGSYRPET